jgi:DMSO/TMAO reductase YedYZ molybdopterin-dependent catalytic subunit
MPKTTVYAELYCVDSPGFMLAGGNWTGVKLGFLLEEVQVLSGAVKVAFHANDGYASDLPVTTAMRDDIIVAYDLNGQPLSEQLRLVVPGKWGYKWVSLLVHIELVNYDFKGTWESRGYSDEADIHPAALLPTDLNGDGRIDLQDLRTVAAAFGSKPGDPEWNEVADLDGNGWTNIVDVTLIAKDYGRTSV